MKYRYGGKEKLLSFGRFPEVGLAAARLKRKEGRAALDAGIDPGIVKPADEASEPRTFEEVARLWHANRVDGLDEAHAKRVLARMQRDAFPLIGAMTLDAVTPTRVLDVVRKVEARGAFDISRRIKQCIGQVFRFAIANGWAVDDPSANLAAALKPRPPVKHMSRVPLSELPVLVAAIRAYDGEATPERREITKKALLFTLLTWARTSEVRFATWPEFEDLDGAAPIWRLPPGRMKMNREHLVPLSRQAVELLRMLRITSTSDFVFPGDKPGMPISENTMIYGCYRLGYRGRQTVHGFRGLGSTWANEAEMYKSEWIELALAHADEDHVRGAYNSALYLAARRRMLQNWADQLDARSETPQQPVARRIKVHVVADRNGGKSLATKRVPIASERYWQRSAIICTGRMPGSRGRRSLRPGQDV